MKTHSPHSQTPAHHDNKPEKHDEAEREQNLDKTIEDSFPASDPPSSIPDPEEEEGKDAA